MAQSVPIKMEMVSALKDSAGCDDNHLRLFVYRLSILSLVRNWDVTSSWSLIRRKTDVESVEETGLLVF